MSRHSPTNSGKSHLATGRAPRHDEPAVGRHTALERIAFRSAVVRDPRAASRPDQPAPADLVDRVRAEFTEMPGLSLTPSQASRLFGLHETTTRLVLGALVRNGMLRLRLDGRYVLSRVS